MVIQAVIDVWGKDKVGVRVGPTGSFNGMYDDNPIETFGTFAKHLNDLGIAYLEVVEDSFLGNHANSRPEEVIEAIQNVFKGTYIANGAYTAEDYADAWVRASKLIQRAPGARGTELHRKIGDAKTPIAIAYWDSKASRDAIAAKHDQAVAEIVRRAAPFCEIRTLGEFAEPEWVVNPGE